MNNLSYTHNSIHNPFHFYILTRFQVEYSIQGEKKKHLGWNLIFILLKLIILWKVTIFFFFFNWFIYFLNLLHAFILVAFTIQDPSDKLGVGFYTRKLSHLNFSWSILFSFFFSFSYIHTHTHTLKLSVSEWQLALRLSWLVPLIESWRQTGLVQ